MGCCSGHLVMARLMKRYRRLAKLCTHKQGLQDSAQLLKWWTTACMMPGICAGMHLGCIRASMRRKGAWGKRAHLL